MSIINFPPFTVHSENVEHVCSEYHFDARYYTWEEVEQYCKIRNHDGLVSMQTEGEWVYFKKLQPSLHKSKREHLKEDDGSLA